MPKKPIKEEPVIVERITAAEYARRKKGEISYVSVRKHLIAGTLPAEKQADGSYLIDWEDTKDILPLKNGEDFNVSKKQDVRSKKEREEDKIPELSVDLIKNDYLTLIYPTAKEVRNNPTLRDFNEEVIRLILLDLMLGLGLSEAALRQGLDPEIVGGWEAINQGNFGRVATATIVEFKRYHLMKVRNGSFNYNMSVWILERKFRDEFGKQSTIIVDDKIQKVRQVMKVGDKEVAFD